VARADLRSRFGAATLWVLEGNTRARRWYEDLGWRRTLRRTPTFAPAGIDDVQHRIELAKSARRRPGPDRVASVRINAQIGSAGGAVAQRL
jgi:hypothetical protein